jgi:hypothetical protein
MPRAKSNPEQQLIPMNETPMIDDDKIVQIIPAEGWFAVYHDGTLRCPVACWALTSGGIVRGMIATKGPPHFAEGLEGFVRFVHVGEVQEPM